MLAAYAAAVGGDDPVANLRVGEQPAPRPRPGWALVRVEAAALNHHDLWTLRGVSSHPVEPPQILGCDAAGVVDGYGPDRPPDTPDPGTRVVLHSVISCGHCAACRDGDQLFCDHLALLSDTPYAGTFAELVTVPAANLVPVPDDLDAVNAACLPTAYLTAYRMLFTRARLQPGHTVLIQGASGGLATASLILARAAGATVIVTSRDESKRQSALRLGAAAALPLDRGTAAEVVRRSRGRGADAVIETVGEPTWETSLRAVRPGGVVVVAGATGGADPPSRLRRVFWRQISILGSTMGTRSELERLLALCVNAGVRPVIDRVFPLGDAVEAMRRMAGGEQMGKIVLTMA